MPESQLLSVCLWRR
uniref:Uncharacterized protein n=1 Tax=Anguilla anguilla TaxID=7936 RepID=A0A0E9VFD9_ANGAN